ncbi:Cof-type HAD-IIB family hydrolase [Mesoplasma photuris]|uniref:Cof-type HAD-IIB family hydrolase n=1 Tax=Mesoplasma photuris TaxID=217731 RepID=UPI0004E1D4F2|nr:HAD family hydrolase [Mesoplasma photuris]
MYKLIAIDVDGTIYRHGKGIHPLTKQALQEAVNQGYKICIATGRNRLSIEPIAEELGIKDLKTPFVAQNGGQVFTFLDNGEFEVDYTNSYSEEKAHELFDIAKQHKAEVFTYTTCDDISYRRGFPVTIFSFVMRFRSKAKRIKYKKGMKLDPAITKFMLFGKTHKMKEVRKIVEAKGCNVFEFSYVADSKSNIEIVPKETDKREGLIYVTNKLNIKPEEVIFFGDGENDLKAIKWAGCGVAMMNAKDYVKDAANDIADYCDAGGVGKYLYDNILNKK